MAKVEKELTYYGVFSADTYDDAPITHAKQAAVTSFLHSALTGEGEGYRTHVNCCTGGRLGVFQTKEEATLAAQNYRSYHGKNRWGCTVTRYDVGKCNFEGKVQLTTNDFSNPKYLLPRVDENEKVRLLNPANIEKAIALYNITIHRRSSF